MSSPDPTTDRLQRLLGRSGDAGDFPATARVIQELHAFIAYPVAVRGKAVGVLVGGRTWGRPLADIDLATVQLFGGQAGLALDRSAS